MSERVRSASRGRHDPSDTAVHLLSFDAVAGAPTCRAAEHEGGLRLHTVFVERVTCLACLNEIIAIGSKLTSGYHRDLQLIKAPLFRAIDLATDVLQVLEAAIGQIHFIPENIRMEQTLYATEEAYRLVVEQGVPFREAYRRIGRKLRDKE